MFKWQFFLDGCIVFCSLLIIGHKAIVIEYERFRSVVLQLDFSRKWLKHCYFAISAQHIYYVEFYLSRTHFDLRAQLVSSKGSEPIKIFQGFDRTRARPLITGRVNINLVNLSEMQFWIPRRSTHTGGITSDHFILRLG